MKKKQELLKKNVCSLIDDMFETMHNEYARMCTSASFSESPSESVSTTRIIEKKVVESDLHDNAEGTRKPKKAKFSFINLNLESIKQGSTNKRKSTSKVMTSKTVKRYRIEKKSETCETASTRVRTSSSSSSVVACSPTTTTSDVIQEVTSRSSTTIKESSKESQKKQRHTTVDMPTSSDSRPQVQIETGISESLFNTEMEINNAMLGVFFDGNSKYFVCDIRYQSNYYKIYNVQARRLYVKKPFSSFSEFQHLFIKPIKFDSSIAANTRVLVAWSLSDTELTPATIKDVYLDHEQVEVHNNKGHCAVISIHDVFILPNYMPIMSDASDVSDASISTTESAQKIFREKPIMDEFYNKYADQKQLFIDEKNYLEGLWRWADLIESGSLIEPDDNKLVNANSFRSVCKNNRIVFNLEDDVVIWMDSNDKGAYKYPIIGIIKRLYENVTTKQKRVQFSWYLHPAEYPDSGLKPLNVSNFFDYKYRN